MKKSLIVIFSVILIDQISKFLVKLNMTLSECIPVFGKWFNILFIENNGMAFGWEISESIWGKLILGAFRIAAVILLFILLKKLSDKDVSFGPLFGISLIIAGALGNIIDGMFYGMIFSESTFYNTAVLFPECGGYAGFMQGKVVDMLYFPLFTFPQWMPFFGGQIFFSPIFNIADSSITIGTLYLIIFHGKFILHTIDSISEKKQEQQELKK